MWDQSGSSLWALAVLVDDLIAGRSDATKVSPELRQHEDRHGLTPKAMLQLRWRIVDQDVVAAATTPTVDDLTKARQERIRKRLDG
jgi:hypothetical protein